MNTLLVPPGISPLGGIFSSKIYNVLNICVFIGAFFVYSHSVDAQTRNKIENPLNNEGLYTTYHDTNQFGSEAGGKRDEERDQNRARHIHRIGIGYRYISPTYYLLEVKTSWMGYHDYAYYNKNNDIHVDNQRLSEAYVRFDTNTVLLQDLDLFLSQPVHDLRSNSRAKVQVGRQAWALDSTGIFFAGESPSLRVDFQGSLGQKKEDVSAFDSLRFRVSAVGSVLEREHRSLRGLQKSRQTPASLYLLQGSVDGDSFSLNIYYSFLKAFGRASKPDVRLQSDFLGVNVDYKFPTGQSARNDLDVHYYGIGGIWHSENGGLVYQLHHNYGRSISVATDGTRIGSSRKSIQGSLAYLDFYYEMGRGVNAASCSVFLLMAGACLDSTPQKKHHRISLHAIYSTRDSDSSDQNLKGYASVRPALGILGGGASILLEGFPGKRENPTFQNRQPAVDFSLNDKASLESFEDYEDNSDPALPDFNNDGVRIGGIEYSYYFPYMYLQNLKIFFNYAAFRFAEGFEMIVALRGSLGPWKENNEKSNNRNSIYWQVSATGSWYTPHDREEDPYTKFSYKASTLFYSRFQAMLSFSF